MKENKLVVRFMKQADGTNRLVLPKVVIDYIKTRDFYLELYEDGTIKLIPIKK